MPSLNSILYNLFVYAPLLASSAATGILPHSAVCEKIAKSISSKSEVYYLPDPEYLVDIEHWMTSSQQNSTCTVEVGSNEDISILMKAVASSKTPFGIKSGGHASNPGFSSTPGVLISMTRFNTIALNSNKTSIKVGMGNIWTDVYDALQGSGYNVNGGRVAGPGTGGFTLGGGYSWLTNQYGLTCDTVECATLILPNGTMIYVDHTQPDLLFALRGGLNRFGVVSEIVYKALPQVPNVYGGYAIYGPLAVDEILAATLNFFKSNTDPKAQVITTINGAPTGLTAIVLFFYDGPESPPSFDEFNKITALFSDVKKQTFASFAKATPSNAEAGHRGAFHTLMTTKLTAGFLDAIKNETLTYGALAPLHGAFYVSYDIEPFATNYGDYATDSAFPHSLSPLPLNLYFAWTGAEYDGYWRDAMANSVNHLNDVAKAEGIFNADNAAYPNYALARYTGDQVYGPTNAARLRTIQDQIDPERVMELAGGFKL